jgi:hypothetical protein
VSLSNRYFRVFGPVSSFRAACVFHLFIVSALPCLPLSVSACLAGCFFVFGRPCVSWVRLFVVSGPARGGLSGRVRRCRFPCACRAVWPCLPVSVFRTNVRSSPFEQIFETLVRVAFWPCLAEFPTESDRILTESQTESQPNLDRISESVSLTVEPNPNRMFESVKILFC